MGHWRRGRSQIPRDQREDDSLPRDPAPGGRSGVLVHYVACPRLAMWARRGVEPVDLALNAADDAVDAAFSVIGTPRIHRFGAGATPMRLLQAGHGGPGRAWSDHLWPC